MVEVYRGIQPRDTVRAITDLREECLPEALSLEDTDTGAGHRDPKDTVHHADLHFATAEVVEVICDLGGPTTAQEEP